MHLYRLNSQVRWNKKPIIGTFNLVELIHAITNHYISMYICQELSNHHEQRLFVFSFDFVCVGCFPLLCASDIEVGEVACKGISRQTHCHFDDYVICRTMPRIIILL